MREKDYPVEVVELKGTFVQIWCDVCLDPNVHHPSLQTLSWTSLGSRKANVSQLFQAATLTLEILVLVLLSRLMSASINLTVRKTTSDFCVSAFYCESLGYRKSHSRFSGTLSARTSNAIRWSPRGRHVVLATVGSSSKSELEFWDLDFNTDDTHRKDPQVDWGTGIQLLGTADHYGVTDVEWDPSGRYLATSASAWTHTVCLS